MPKMAPSGSRGSRGLVVLMLTHVLLMMTHVLPMVADESSIANQHSLYWWKKFSIKRSKMSWQDCICKGGGLDLARQFEKGHLDSWDFLDGLKKDISTNLNKFYAVKSLFVWIFIFVSVETLNLDISKTDISTVWKRTSQRVETSRSRLLSTVESPRLNDLNSWGMDEGIN
jgi:hypothetical protein